MHLEILALATLAILAFVVATSNRDGQEGGPEARARAFVASLALQDWLVLGYVVALWGLVGLGHGPRQDTAFRWVTADLAAYIVLLALGRARGVPRVVANVAYRLALPGAIMITFAQLHYILPSARDVSFDTQIYQADKAVFGFEPAEAWDAYVSPKTTEWFSFFYYLYFGILMVHVLPMAFVERRMKLLREFSWGIFWVFCIGQLVYVLVPGYGPYKLLAPTFAHDLEGETFWPLVSKTVASFDGAHRTDIFPSLHTAVPTFFTLFAIRHRAHVPFRYTWPVMAFVTSNIILATMFLRWHYLLDVIAGLVLATSAFLTARCLPGKEEAARARTGRSPIWRPLFGHDPLGHELEPEPCFARRIPTSSQAVE
jgi:hypothetical protein